MAITVGPAGGVAQALRPAAAARMRPETRAGLRNVEQVFMAYPDVIVAIRKYVSDR
jgi:hypothetical protein